MKTKRGLVISDLHCGHKIGFTPPSYDAKTKHNEEQYKMRRMIWRWALREAKKRGPYDFMLVNGDCIDGRGEKSGGTELLTSDRMEQVRMAADSIKAFNVKKIVMSYGTGYHTGNYEDFEDMVADKVSAEKIGGEDSADVNGCIINYRHFISRSSIPHGRHTPSAKEHMWNQLWAMRGEYPLAQIIIRSHVHYHTYAGGAGWVSMVTPALQNYGSKYGGRIVTGEVDVGFVVLNIWNKGEWAWEAPVLRMPYHEPISL